LVSSCGQALGIDLANLVGAALNFLFLDGEVSSIPARSSSLHRSVFRRIARSFDNVLGELVQADWKLGVLGAFGRLTDRDCIDRYPALRAHDVDLLEPSGGLDPSPWLDPDVSALLSEPAELFPHGVAHIGKVVHSREANEGDRVSLVIKALRAGKLSLMVAPQASADTFRVAKPGSTKLREVWNGSALTAVSASPLKPPLQACPCSLATLECSHDVPLRVPCRDGRAFFDQLSLPHALRGYFGRPAVSIDQLLCPPACESGGATVLPMSRDEIDSCLLDSTLDQCTGALVPVSNVYPMGFGWSSYVAQNTMVHSVLQAGFGSNQLLHGERVVLPFSSRALAVATDDVHLFKRAVHTESSSELCPLQVLDDEWDRIGLIGHPSKRVDDASDARVLGLEFRQGTRLQSRGQGCFPPDGCN